VKLMFWTVEQSAKDKETWGCLYALNICFSRKKYEFSYLDTKLRKIDALQDWHLPLFIYNTQTVIKIKNSKSSLIPIWARTC
jgi:hypothetical protein